MRRTAGGRACATLLALSALTTLVPFGFAAVAQEVEVEDGFAVSRPAGQTGPALTEPVTGEIHTWEDGDRTLRAFLQSDLVMTREGAIASVGDSGEVVADTADGKIVRVASAASVAEGLPVFRSVSGALMTLPGGVLLVFDREVGAAEREAFFDAHGIGPERLSPLGEIPNGFVVETEPGFPSLALANALAGLPGVRLASPNWWREHRTR